MLSARYCYQKDTAITIRYVDYMFIIFALGLVKIFTTDYLRKPLIIALVMQLSQQLSGINAVFYYSTPLFIEAGIPEEYRFNKTHSSFIHVLLSF